jgi:Holliday junction resolvasome RuvABC endonuclease subunit
MAIDAGLQGMGIVIAEDGTVIYCGANRTKKAPAKKGLRVADDDADRCQQHARFLLRVITMYRPQGAIVELPSGGAQGARANRAMGMATGIVVTALEAAGLPVEWVTPADVKDAAAGDKAASKGDVQKGVRERLKWSTNAELVIAQSYKNELEHIYDAAGALLAAEHGTLMRALNQKGA